MVPRNRSDFLPACCFCGLILRSTWCVFPESCSKTFPNKSRMKEETCSLIGSLLLSFLALSIACT